MFVKLSFQYVHYQFVISKAHTTRTQNGYQNLDFNAASILDCKQTAFRVPSQARIAMSSPNFNWHVFVDYLDQYAECVMRNFAFNQLQMLRLKRKLRQLTKR